MDTLTQQHPGGLSSAVPPTESAVSAVSWSAILAGACVATASSLVLMELGSGLGLASLSAWPNSGGSITTFTATMAIWFIVVQWLASGIGGYIAGRLRTKWANTHTHEVFFRDTAHGFITWALATILITAAMTSAGALAIAGSVHAAATAASGAIDTTVAPDAARKAASEAAIYGALSMLVGAFIACIAAALGGQRRDRHM